MLDISKTNLKKKLQFQRYTYTLKTGCLLLPFCFLFGDSTLEDCINFLFSILWHVIMIDETHDFQQIDKYWEIVVPTFESNIKNYYFWK